MSEKRQVFISVVCKDEKSETILNAIKGFSPRWISTTANESLYSILGEIFLTEDEADELLNFIHGVCKPGIIIVHMHGPSC